jgi:hypothetical protein
MVSAMANAYAGLSEEERELVFMLAVGRDDYKGDDENFCKGFAACADDSSGSWWSGWDVEQRDVFFYMKMDPNDENSWSYHCRYSMNQGRDEFDDTIREMLTLSASISEQLQDVVEVEEVEFEVNDDDLGDNETSIESETPMSIMNLSEPLSESVSSSASSSNFLPALMLSAGVLGFSLI